MYTYATKEKAFEAVWSAAFVQGREVDTTKGPAVMVEWGKLISEMQTAEGLDLDEVLGILKKAVEDGAIEHEDGRRGPEAVVFASIRAPEPVFKKKPSKAKLLR
jgi:hypothetical protein